MENNELNIKLSKQQLASQIWKTCDDMRSDSGMDSSEYKTYIIGLLFYKWVSEQEERYLKKKFFTDFSKLTPDNTKIKDMLQKNIGYFIPNEYLFSTWVSKKDTTIKTVSDALIDFDNNIYKEYEKQYKGILDDLKKGLDKLGSTTKDQNKAINKLIKVINRIPTTSNDYDVLGYVYEYLISNFASSAGKKAGEFYTPHEPSEIMSRIVANHLIGRDDIKVYDPTSGSASLLMTIGNAYVKEGGKFDNVTYFAQEKNPVTHNLTRINLIMKGIAPSNFYTRNNNTLTEDWPYYETNGVKKPIIVDAVVSNPPYSAKWAPFDDDRFEYGKAPKGKADYAFLLHDLYHLDTDGILAIVLPHGVLFRGKEDDEAEGTIRKNLIDNNHIETIIGLPANIFFGTGIPTIIMILKQKRETNDVLFIDASRGFIKDGKKNKIRECDIKKISDTVINRSEIPNYSRIVKKDEIKKNNYNLNIPRYVDSGDKNEPWDVHAIMKGVIPNTEIDDLNKYWSEFKSLKGELFEPIDNSYSNVKNNLDDIFNSNKEIKTYKEKYEKAFKGFESFLCDELLKDFDSINVNKIESNITNKIFENLKGINLIDAYALYQIFADMWKGIASDLDIISKYGKKSITEVAPIYEFNDDGDAIQKGEDGTIIPLELVKSELLSTDYENIKNKKTKIDEIKAEYETILSDSDPDEINDITNDDNTKFVAKEVNKKVAEIFQDIEDGEIGVLKQYLSLLDEKAKKEVKLEFIKTNDANWKEMESNKDGTYSKKVVNEYLKKLYNDYQFEDDAIENSVIKVSNLITEEKAINSEIKELDKELTAKSIDILTHLSLEDATKLLKSKWVLPLVKEADNFVNVPITHLKERIRYLEDKYSDSLINIEDEINSSSKELIKLMSDLTGSDDDLKGIKELTSLLKGDNND